MFDEVPSFIVSLFTFFGFIMFYSTSANYHLHNEVIRPFHLSSNLQITVTIGHHCDCDQIHVLV